MSIAKMSNEEVYYKYYEKLPKIVSLICSCVVAVVGLLDVLISTEFFFYSYDGLLSFLVGSEAYASAIVAILVWAILVVLNIRVLYAILKISFSQKIMVVQRLTEIKDK